MSELHLGFRTCTCAHAQLVRMEADAVLCCSFPVGFPDDRKLNFKSTCTPHNQRESVRIRGTYCSVMIILYFKKGLWVGGHM